MNELVYSNQTKIIKNFGKAVLYMLFHQNTIYKIVLKLSSSPAFDILFNNILSSNLSSFLKACLKENSSQTISGLKEHVFLTDSQDNDNKLKLGEELIEFIENKKTKKGNFEDTSILNLYSIRDEDSKVIFHSKIIAKISSKLRKKKSK